MLKLPNIKKTLLLMLVSTVVARIVRSRAKEQGVLPEDGQVPGLPESR